MLFPTHRKMGYQSALIASSVLVSTPLYKDLGLTSMTAVSTAVLLLLGSGSEGCQFPDIDSASSIPRKNHPILGKIFDILGIEHRGPISHGLPAETIIWLTVAIITSILIKNYGQTNPSGARLIVQIFLVISIARIVDNVSIFLYGCFRSKSGLAGLPQNIMYLITGNNDHAQASGYHHANAKEEFGIKIFSYLVGSFFVLNIGGIGIQHLNNYLLIYFAGYYLSVLSHLVADLSTTAGLPLFGGKNYAPIHFFMHLPFFHWFIGEGKTGSAYEDRYSVVVSIINLLLIIFLIKHMLLLRF